MSIHRSLRLLVIPVVVVVLVLAGMALVPFFISTEFVRAAAERQITGFAGRPVSLGGPTEVSLFPNPRATLRDVTIAGPDGLAPLARVESMTVDMSLASLLRGHAKVTGVHLVQPFIHVILDGENRDVLDFLPLRDIGRVVSLTRQQREEERAQGLAIAENGVRRPLRLPDSLDLRGGTLTFERGRGLFERTGDRKAGGGSLTFRSLDGRIDWPRLDGALRINADLELAGVEVGGTLESTHPLDLLASVEAPISLALDSAVGTMRFSGTGGYLAGPFGSGTFSFRSDALGELLETVGLTGARERLTETMSAAGNVHAQGNKLRFDDLDLKAENSSGTGIAELIMSDTKAPMLTATLDFDNLDLRALLSAFTPLPDGPADSGTINLAFMDRVLTDMRLSARTANFGALDLQQLAAAVRTTPALALFDIGDAMAAGGRASARLRFEREAGSNRISLAATGENVDFATLKTALSLPPLMPLGRGNVSVRLDTDATRWSSITESGDGMIKMTMDSGIIPGLDGTILVPGESAEGLRQLNLQAAGTSFSAFKLSGPITDGVIRLENTHIAYPQTTLTLDGFVPVNGNGLAMTAKRETEDAQSARFFVGGSLERPYVLPVLQPAEAQQAD